MTAALTRSKILRISTFQFSARSITVQVSVKSSLFPQGQTVPNSDRKTSWTEANSSGPLHNQVTLTCRAQTATCRDCRDQSDHRYAVRSGQLV